MGDINITDLNSNNLFDGHSYRVNSVFELETFY